MTTPADRAAEAIRLVEAATPGPWFSGVALCEADHDNYWADSSVLALMKAPPDASLPDLADGEARCEALSEWCDQYERGTVAETHNWLSISDAEHDANSRLIAAARSLLPALAADVQALTERMMGLARQLRHAEAERDTAAAIADRLLDGWHPHKAGEWYRVDLAWAGEDADAGEVEPMTDAERAFILHHREEQQ